MEYENIRIPKFGNMDLTPQQLADELDAIVGMNYGNVKIAETVWAILYQKSISNAIQKYGTDFNAIVDLSQNVRSSNGLYWSFDVKGLLTSFVPKSAAPASHFIQRIIYGSPGTGKSFSTKRITNGMEVFRTTFHPDTDYASFVGSYKPSKVKNMDNSGTILGYDDLKKELENCKVNFSKNFTDACVIFGFDNYHSLVELCKDDTALSKLVLDVFTTDSHYTSFIATGMCLYRSKHGYNSRPSDKITYEFIPQVFTNAYIKAWQNYLHPDTNSGAKKVCLLIEELNRGNCAQIFGDIFQLLDRRSSGFSEYSIIPDADLSEYIKSKLGTDFQSYYDKIRENSDLDDDDYPTIDVWDASGTDNNKVHLCLPPNLNIVCTMNTSDQSLFPMDSAFKRRWDWQYVPIDYDNAKSDFLIKFDDTCYYQWSDFLKQINDKIEYYTHSEDKQMGNFFVKGDENLEVDSEQFVSKVMFYLWSEICKDNPKAKKQIFVWTKEHEVKEGEPDNSTDYDNDFSFSDLFGESKVEILHGFMLKLNVQANAIE